MFQLVLLGRSQQQQRQRWALDGENSVGLPGAHGGDVVRAFCLDDAARAVFTAGEDGCVRAWQPA